MRILQLCLRFPFPARDGGTMAMTSLANGLLANGIDLHILALNTSKHLANKETIAQAQKKYQIKAHFLNNTIGFKNTFANLFSRKAFHVSRFYNVQIELELIKLLREISFDAVIFESIFMSPYLPAVQQNSRAISVLRSHNIEYKIWEGVCAETKNLAKRAYLNLQMKRLKKYEIETSGLFDIIAAITQVDVEFYRNLKSPARVINLPFGIEVKPQEKAKNITQKFTVGFLGSMDWMPNQEGIRWFLAEIWPLVLAESNNIFCTIAGRYMPLNIAQNKQANLSILGEVEDAKAFFSRLDLTIVPLRSGSGVRIKVLESMALGTPVLATKVGFDGIDAQNGFSIIESNSPPEFANSILRFAKEPVLLQEIAKNAQNLVEEQYSVKASAHVLASAIQQIMATR